jgi:hypothetical protein
MLARRPYVQWRLSSTGELNLQHDRSTGHGRTTGIRLHAVRNTGLGKRMARDGLRSLPRRPEIGGE